MLAKQLTIASRCPSAPMTIGHAGTCVVSLQGVPSVTGVGHCGSNVCTRATSLSICRSIRGWTTAGACTEGTGTAFLVATMASTCTSMQTKRHAITHMHNHASKSTYYIQNHTQMYVHACTIHAYKGMVHVNTCIYVYIQLTIVA